MQNFLTLKEIVERIEKLPPDLRRNAKKKLLKLSRTKTINEIKDDFLTFVKKQKTFLSFSQKVKKLRKSKNQEIVRVTEIWF